MQLQNPETRMEEPAVVFTVIAVLLARKLLQKDIK
jgi:hypothetical protein